MEEYIKELNKQTNEIYEKIEAYTRIRESINYIESYNLNLNRLAWQLDDSSTQGIEQDVKERLIAELKKKEKELETEIKQYEIIKIRENG